MKDGRPFVASDADAGRHPLVINETFARRYLGADRPVGRTLEANVDDGAVTYEVVGVVADTRYDLRKPPAPTVYLMPIRGAGTLHLRVAGDPRALAARVRDEVRAASTALRVTGVTAQAAVVARTLLVERLLALLAGFFAIVGLVLTAVGLFGVMSYALVRRTRELGIRMTLGARPVRVVWHLLAGTVAMGLVGAAVGLAGGLYLSRFLDALLFEVTPFDVWSLALPLGTLFVAAVAAAALPAIRAWRIDPVAALRQE